MFLSKYTFHKSHVFNKCSTPMTWDCCCEVTNSFLSLRGWLIVSVNWPIDKVLRIHCNKERTDKKQRVVNFEKTTKKHQTNTTKKIKEKTPMTRVTFWPLRLLGAPARNTLSFGFALGVVRGPWSWLAFLIGHKLRWSTKDCPAWAQPWRPLQSGAFVHLVVNLAPSIPLGIEQGVLERGSLAVSNVLPPKTTRAIHPAQPLSRWTAGTEGKRRGTCKGCSWRPGAFSPFVSLLSAPSSSSLSHPKEAYLDLDGSLHKTNTKQKHQKHSKTTTNYKTSNKKHQHAQNPPPQKKNSAPNPPRRKVKGQQSLGRIIKRDDLNDSWGKQASRRWVNRNVKFFCVLRNLNVFRLLFGWCLAMCLTKRPCRKMFFWGAF